MRSAAAIALVALVACGGGGGDRGKLEQLRDTVCGCKTKACVDRAADDNKQLLDKARRDREEGLGPIAADLDQCADRVAAADRDRLALDELELAQARRDEMCACKDEACAKAAGGKREPDALFARRLEKKDRDRLEDALHEYDECKGKFGGVAFAVVMNGWELWVGNDREVPELEVDDPSRSSGALIAIREAFAKAAFGVRADSLGMLVTYADKATTRVPMGPIGALSAPAAFGTQKDYYGTTGVELVSGVTLALAELHRVGPRRKLLLVLGDGNDTNNDDAGPALAALRKEAEKDRVQITAIVYKSKLSGDGMVVNKLTDDVHTITTIDNIAPQLQQVFERAR